MPDLLATAIGMADQSYAVFPLPPLCKAPTNKDNPESLAEYGPQSCDWADMSTSDTAVIAAYWPDIPCNIGIDCGKSGVIVVDVDVKRGPGIQEFNLLCKINGLSDWPDTWTVRTASGGLHFYFEVSDTVMRNSAGLIAPDIDIRARGGYVVGWGSVVDGREYTVLNDSPPMPAPRWLVTTEARLRQAKDTRAAAEHGTAKWSLQMLTPSQLQAKLDGLRRNLAETPEGNRNDMLNWTAYQLGNLSAAGRIDEETAWELCSYGCEANGHASWGEYGVRATFRSGFRAGLGGAR